MVGGAVMGYMSGLHYWWPKITGRLYPESWGRLAALIIFIGFNLTFFPQFVLGYLGMPRRYHTYPPEFQVLNVMSSAGASILGVGYLLPLIYLIWSLRYGPIAGPNPWRATGLEWQTSSPPPTDNFLETPVVTDEPYNYEQGHGQWLIPTPLSRISLTTLSNSMNLPRWACGFSWRRKSCFLAGYLPRTRFIASCIRRPSKRPATISISSWARLIPAYY